MEVFDLSKQFWMVGCLKQQHRFRAFPSLFFASPLMQLLWPHKEEPPEVVEMGLPAAEQKEPLEPKPKDNCSGLGCNQELEDQKGSSCNRFPPPNTHLRWTLVILAKDTTSLS